MSMSPAKVFAFGLSAIVVGVCATALLWTQVIDPAEPYQRPPAQQVDVSGLPAYWESTFKASTWYGATSAPQWDGNFLSSTTTAEEDALTICGALSSWWATSNQPFESVRVQRPDGFVLVSRHLESDPCTVRK